jgi:hypothetical protein
MHHRFLVSVGMLGMFWLVSTAVTAQTPAAAPKTSAAKGWTLARTPDGQPDLQGVWSNNNVTPLERPKQFGGRQYLTDEELTTLKQRAAQLFAGDGDAAFGDALFETLLSDTKKFVSRDGRTGDYNQFWLVERDWSNRTSLITDPPDGRLPALTAEGARREAAAAAARQSPAAGPEDRSLSERCITFGVPRLQAAYNSYYQIVQSPGYVAIMMETIHDTRIIPLDNRPHIPQDIRQWHGDPRGHWEGATLVVETTNFSPKSNFRGANENLRLVERFTRVGSDTLNYEVTVTDPTIWTRPWTAMIPLRRTTDLVYEYECHEGNSGLAGILAGARADEKATK